MHVVDLTMLHAPRSGGIKRYLLAKHDYYRSQPIDQHSMIVPGARDMARDPGRIELASCPIPFGGGYRVPLRLSRWRAQLERLSPDVIEVGDPYQLAWTALDAAHALSVPAVAFVHSDVAQWSTHNMTLKSLADLYLRNLYSRFDLVLAPSRLIAQRLARLGIESVAVQRLGVDLESFHPRHRDAGMRAQLGIAASARLLIFAGRMGREKGISELLRTFTALGENYHLVIVGGTTAKALAPNITLLPYRQNVLGVARLIASADALVHAGRQETFGLVALEAMACGRPVVGIRSGAIPELVDDDVGTLAEPEDKQGLRAAIERLYTRDLDELGRCGRARAETMYSWENVFSSQLERYRRLRHSHSFSSASTTQIGGMH